MELKRALASKLLMTHLNTDRASIVAFNEVAEESK